MGAKVGGSSKGGMDEINVTPLIDVVLVLLIIFMVLVPVTVQKMASELPPKDDAAPPPPPDPSQPKQLLVAVYEDNSFALNLMPMEEAKLAEELKKQLAGRTKENKNVFVDGAPSANYDTIVHVIDVAREAGAARVGFAEMKEEGPARLTPEQVLQLQSGTLALPGTEPAPAAPAAPATP